MAVATEPVAAGAITILCADAVQSTQQIASDTPRFEQAEEELLRLGQQAASANNGLYYQGGGDGFLLLFDSPVDAVLAACDVQARLLGADWPPELPRLSLRVGIHSDNLRYVPERREYMGYGMHCAQRVMAAAHGCQILLSDATHALIRPSSSRLPGIRCEPCGEIELRGIPAPQPLFLVLCEGLALCDRAPRTAGRGRTNLPGEDRPFIGREAEVGEVLALLRESGRRMVSIVGLGGIGKTRLALKVAERSLGDYADGVWFVPCGGTSSGEELEAAVVGAMGVDVGGRPAARALDAALQAKEVLLLLDCCEHLGGASASIGRLLGAAPGARVLVTSRRALGLRWECLYHLNSLAAGEGARAAADGPALFVDSARYADHTFRLTAQNQEAVREICRTLEGIPLAIVLAAARLSVRTLPQLLDQVRASRFRVASDMRQIVAEQFRLLPDAEQQLLWQLSVFTGGFYAEDAASVCADDEADVLDGLEQLHYYTLLETRRIGDQMRYHILDTVREYLTEAAGGASPDVSVTRERHAARYAVVAREIDAQMSAGRWREGTARLWLEIGNLRAASRFSLEDDRPELVAEFADALGRIYVVVGLWSEFEELARRAEPILGQQERRPARARLLARQGALAKLRGDFAAARAFWERRLALCTEIGDHAGRADALQDLAGLALAAGDLARAGTLARRALRAARSAGDAKTLAAARVLQAQIGAESGDAEQARRSAQEAEAQLRSCGDRDAEAFALPLLGRVYRQLGQTERAEAALLEAIRVSVEGNRLWDVARAASELGAVYADEDRLDLAARSLVVAARIHSELGSRMRKEAADALEAFRQSHAAAGAEASIAAAQRAPWRQNCQMLVGQVEPAAQAERDAVQQ